jgi:hypothetical protein
MTDYKDEIRARMIEYDRVPRSALVEEYGQEVVDAVEAAFTHTPQTPGERAMEFVEIQTNDKPGAERVAGRLRETIRSGMLAGVPVVTDASRRCNVFTDETGIPFYDSPSSISDPVAWATVCMETRTFMAASNPDAGTRGVADGAESFMLGLSNNSIESIRGGLSESSPVVPLPYIHVNVDGSFNGQEGRNRGLSASLEGFDYMNTQVMMFGDS